MTEYHEARGRPAEQRKLQSQILKQKLLGSGLPNEFGKLCLRAPGLLLLKVSQAER